jgi:hypothetical protein
MNEPRSNQDRQTIGLYEVFLQDQTVVLGSPHLESARLFKPDEALKLLEWLDRHQDDFRKALHANAVTC